MNADLIASGPSPLRSIWLLLQRHGYHSPLPVRQFRRSPARRNQTSSLDGDNARQQDVELQSCSVRSERRAALNRNIRLPSLSAVDIPLSRCILRDSRILNCACGCHRSKHINTPCCANSWGVGWRIDPKPLGLILASHERIMPSAGSFLSRSFFAVGILSCVKTCTR